MPGSPTGGGLTRAVAALSILLCAAICIGTATAQSEPPIPTVGIGESQKPESEPDRKDHKANDEQRGTESAPIVVKILPAAKNQDEAYHERKERHQNAAADRGAIIIGLVTAGILLLQTAVFGAQAHRLKQTIVAMQKIGADQSRDMQASIAAAQTSADAAKESANAAIAQVRPWVTCHKIEAHDFVVKTEFVRANITFQLTNTGTSPAQNVRVTCAWHLGATSIEEQDTIIARLVDEPIEGKYSIFPNDNEHKFTNGKIFSTYEITSSPFFTNLKTISPQIIAVFVYEFDYSNRRHKTAFVINLFQLKKSPPGFYVGGENVTPGEDISVHIQRTVAD